MKKYLYTTLLLALLAQEGVMAQENEGKKGKRTQSQRKESQS